MGADVLVGFLPELWRYFCEESVDILKRKHYCYFADAATLEKGVA